MLALDLDLNPRVRDIIKTALKEAQPIWVNLTEDGKEIWERRAIWMIAIAPERFENGNAVQWEATARLIVDGCVLSVTKNGAPFVSASLLYPCRMNAGDTIVCVEGAIRFNGIIPWTK